jgi:chloramphenicol O-acetyltransferase
MCVCVCVCVSCVFCVCSVCALNQLLILSVLFVVRPRIDDVIYADFRKSFPSLDVAMLEEKVIKTEKAKTQWRPFCERYKNEVAEYNFATLVRTDSKAINDPSNMLVVPRIQFLAIEIARNREGHNDWICKETDIHKDDD